MKLEEAQEKVRTLTNEGINARLYPDPDECDGWIVQEIPRPQDEIKEDIVVIRGRVEKCKKDIRQLSRAIELYQKSIDNLYKEMMKYYPEEEGKQNAEM